MVKQGKCLAYQRCSRKRPFHNGTPPAHPFRFRLYLQCQRALAGTGEKLFPSEKLSFQPLGLGGRVLRVHRTPVKELFQSFFPRRFFEPDQRVNPKLRSSHRSVLSRRRQTAPFYLGRPEKLLFFRWLPDARGRRTGRVVRLWPGSVKRRFQLFCKLLISI